MTALDNTALEGQARTSARLPAIDIARGIAVVAMVIYHGAWDLSNLALADLDVSGSPGWNLFARSIAASFLILAGIGLALAHRGGIRWPHFLRRLAVIAAAAAAITLTTYLVFPRSYIFFGILHNMVASSVLAAPFVLVSPAFAALASLVVLGLPHLVEGGGLLDLRALAFLGLGQIPPLTNDWVPIFPWTGYVLAGIALAPLVSAVPWRGDGGALGRTLATFGRHSLVIYLLHQPLLFGAALGVRHVMGVNPTAEAAPFVRQCTNSCQAQGRTKSLCARTCGCTVEALRRDGIWNSILGGDPSGEFMQRAGNRAAECLKRESAS